LQGFGLDYTATAQPTLSDLSIGYRHPVLRFAISTFWWLVLALAQILWDFVIFRRYFKDVVGDFLDLCSVANVSIFMLDEKYHGFYLHGRSVHSHADTNLKEMHDMFKREEVRFACRSERQNADAL